MDKILIVDFGGQYNQLIAKRIRSLNVYSEIMLYTNIPDFDYIKNNYKGIVFTGGPQSVYEENSAKVDKAILNTGIPILGICYGAQLIAYLTGGEVISAKNNSEYGKTIIEFKDCTLFENIPKEIECFMSHSDCVNSLSQEFQIIASTKSCKIAAYMNEEKKLYGVQFHPEVNHTEHGIEILENFVINICKCNKDWIIKDYVNELIAKYRDEINGKKVLLALSGGVDSSVVALLLNKAIGSNLFSIFIDHGLLRKGESENVEKIYKERFGNNFIKVDASIKFLKDLEGITEPERKRKIIGEDFIRVFETESDKYGPFDYLAQGTIYPDIIESGNGVSHTIKSHHNVGGLPDNIKFSGIVEPLKLLFKDEVRELGLLLGLPKELVFRQPFPGPGLAVRIIGEITIEKVKILQLADEIVREEILNSNMNKMPNQYFATLLDTRSVGVKGDVRVYGYTVAVRSVSTSDFMTASFTEIPYSILERISNRITNEIKDVTRVVYDITSKPPATIEWE